MKKTDCPLHQTCDSMRVDLSKCGARIGILEPVMHQIAATLPDLDLLMAELRARKDYATSDRLRTSLKTIREAIHFAFPGRYE